MKKLKSKTITLLTATLLMIFLQGCSQFETPLEIPEMGTIQVITTSDAKCTLYKSNNLLMEWTGSKIIPGLLAGNYKVKISSDKFNSSHEESFQLDVSQHKILEIGTGGLDIKIKSNYTWELTKDNKLILSGKGSLKIDTLWTGEYKLKVVVPGVSNNFIRDISISKSQTYLLEMEYGSLDVRIPSTMEATLLHGTTELDRWNGSRVIDSLWLGDYTVKIKVNPLLSDYETNFTLAKQQIKVVEPLFGSFTIKTKSDYQNTLLLEGVEQLSWIGDKEINPCFSGNYMLKSKMFTNSSSIDQSFTIQPNEDKTVKWEYGKITTNTISNSTCELKRDGIGLHTWQGSSAFDSIITGTYTIEIQEAVDHPKWSEIFTLIKDEQKSISIPYSTLQITTNESSSTSKLIYNGNVIKTLTGSGSISNIVPGTYSLTIDASGYNTQTENITLTTNQNLSKNIKLLPFMQMVSIPDGTFIMGCTSRIWCQDNEFPTHQVSLSSYSFSKFEITQKQWREVMGTSPSYFTGDNKPVEQVSWYEVVAFCNELSIREGLTKAYTINDTNITCNFQANGYRLPTEAEWEYAALGGASSTFTIYSGSNILSEVAWYNSNSSSTTHDVGTKLPNQLGIYDMSGNVYEWVWDYYGSYTSGSQTNPTGPTNGSLRLLRGGGWFHGGDFSRPPCRNHSYPVSRSNYIGVRVVRTN